MSHATALCRNEATRTCPQGAAATEGVETEFFRQDVYWTQARAYLSRLLTLADVAPWRVTYGACDREFWHYRTADFPCGMQQEAALALALAYRTNKAGNPWAASKRIREVAIAAMRFTARTARTNGALDDYFPYEQAVGATAFAVRAVAEARELLRVELPEVDDWLVRAVRWLLGHRETGFLANHEALVVLAATLVGQRFGRTEFIDAARRRLGELLAQQTREGWFSEYGGCDPGYHTVLVAFLADLWRRTAWPELEEPLERAVRFAAAVQHPDGSFGGEYGSRNTFHCYAHGFELMAHLPEASGVARKLARGLERGFVLPPEDDRMVAHYAVDRLLALRDCQDCPHEAVELTRGSDVQHFRQAGFVVLRKPQFWGIVGCSKGGVVKLYRGSSLVLTDTGLVVRLKDGTVAAACIGPPERVTVERGGCIVEGRLYRMNQPLMSPVKHVLFRLANITVGRFCPNLLRFLVQRLAITGRCPTPVRYRRCITWRGAIAIEDSLYWGEASPVGEVWLSTDATAMYVAASEAYQRGTRHGWMDMTRICAKSQGEAGCVLKRKVVFPV